MNKTSKAEKKARIVITHDHTPAQKAAIDYIRNLKKAAGQERTWPVIQAEIIAQGQQAIDQHNAEVLSNLDNR